jgi:hypothetical protein
MQLNGKVSKKSLFCHMVIFWMVVYFLITLACYLSIVNKFHIKKLNTDLFVFSTSIFCISFFTFAVVHHTRAWYNKTTGKLFSSERGNSLLMRTLRPNSVRNGIFIGIKLDTYLKRASKKEMADKFIDYIFSKNVYPGTKIILRSHLLSSKGIRNYIVNNIEKKGGHCTFQVDLPTNSKFMLLWLTPAIQGVFQLYIPVFRQYEAEIIIKFNDVKVVSKC